MCLRGINNTCITLFPKNQASWEEFIGIAGDQLESLFERQWRSGYKEDYLWILKTQSSYYFAFLSAKGQGDTRAFYIAKTAAIDLAVELDTSYLLLESDTSPMHKDKVVANFRFLQSENGMAIDPDFPLFTHRGISVQERKLVIKYGNTDKFIVQMPYDYYCLYRLGGFSDYTWIEYIGSDIDFLKHLKIWLDIEEKGSNPAEFLRHSLIYVNFYPHSYTNDSGMSDVHGCIPVLERIKKLFLHVRTRSGPLQLRLEINPDASLVLPELEKESNLFLFANFHTVKGEWTLPVDDGTFHRKAMEVDLSHFLLMRLSHCRSLIGIGNRPSIVNQLLNKGVKRVEGSIDRQSIRSYLEYLLTFFIRTGLNVFLALDPGLKETIYQQLALLKNKIK